jgi:hypothetical protein
MGVSNSSRSQVQLLDENGVAYGVKEVDNKPVVTTDGEVLEGTITKQNITDISLEQILTDILKELRKMNVQLSLMTDAEVKNVEVE